MTPAYDAVFLLAFGGPTSREDVRPFIGRVLHGHRVPAGRIEEVITHYEALGGLSPLNEITLRQGKALEELLRAWGSPLPVYVGFRHSRPFIRETLDLMVADGIRRAVGFILSPHQTEASWERYQKNVLEACSELGGCAPDIDYCPGWHDHPLLIEAWAEKIELALKGIPDRRRQQAALIFTAHSVPSPMAARSSYAQQIAETSRLVAERLRWERWFVAYQSRSGWAQESWLEPDVKDVIRALARAGVTEVVVAPIGFVCDHVEVLYDLDIEARARAESLGVRFARAASLNDHPTFIRMMAEVIKSKLESQQARRQKAL